MSTIQTQLVDIATGQMRVMWDAPIEMDDGTVLRADIFLPAKEGVYPVIIALGPYAKGLAFQDGYKSSWDRMTAAYPEILQGTTARFANWEVVDPEKWTPDGYVCIRIDSRGAGRSPGTLDIFSPRETLDFHDCIEWVAGQPWSNGKVGINGISYLAMNQWQVAALQPPHLTAICAWEAAADSFRDWHRHGGISASSRIRGSSARSPPGSMAWATAATRAASPGSLYPGRKPWRRRL